MDINRINGLIDELTGRIAIAEERRIEKGATIAQGLLKEAKEMVRQNKLKEGERLLKMGKIFCWLSYTFEDFPKPFVDQEGNIDAVFVFGHTRADINFAIPPSFPSEDFLLPSFADVREIVPLAAKFGLYSKKGLQLPQGRLAGSLTQEEKRSNNIISVGSGAVNPLTREILERYASNLPIYFLSPESDHILRQEIAPGANSTIDSDSDPLVGYCLMVPNPQNEEKVVLILAGVRSIGTQSAAMALHKGFDRMGRRLCDAKYRGGINIPARLVRGTLKEGLRGQVLEDFIFID